MDKNLFRRDIGLKHKTTMDNREKDANGSAKKARLEDLTSKKYPSEVVDLKALRSIKVPRKEHTDGVFTKVSVNSKEFAEEIRPIVLGALKLRQSERQLRFLTVCLINNSRLQSEYTKKRNELKKELQALSSGGGVREQGVGGIEGSATDNFGFVYVPSKEVLLKLSEEGIHNGNLKLSKLGNPEMGVSVCQYADIYSTSPVPRNGWLLIVKYIRGRINYVHEDSNPLDPQPHYDSHISKTNKFDTTHIDANTAFHSSQVFLYEYTEDFDLVTRPRHVLPYAAIQFSFSGPSSLAGAKLGQTLPPSAKRRISSGSYVEPTNGSRHVHNGSGSSNDNLRPHENSTTTEPMTNIKNIINHNLHCNPRDSGPALSGGGDRATPPIVLEPRSAALSQARAGRTRLNDDGRLLATSQLVISGLDDWEVCVELVTYRPHYLAFDLILLPQLEIYELCRVSELFDHLSLGIDSELNPGRRLQVNREDETPLAHPPGSVVTYLRLVMTDPSRHRTKLSRLCTFLTKNRKAGRIKLPHCDTSYCYVFPDGTFARSLGIPEQGSLDCNFLHAIIVTPRTMEQHLAYLFTGSIEAEDRLVQEMWNDTLLGRAAAESPSHNSQCEDFVLCPHLLVNSIEQQSQLQKTRLFQLVRDSEAPLAYTSVDQRSNPSSVGGETGPQTPPSQPEDNSRPYEPDQNLLGLTRLADSSYRPQTGVKEVFQDPPLSSDASGVKGSESAVPPVDYADVEAKEEELRRRLLDIMSSLQSIRPPESTPNSTSALLPPPAAALPPVSISSVGDTDYRQTPTAVTPASRYRLPASPPPRTNPPVFPEYSHWSASSANRYREPPAPEFNHRPGVTMYQPPSNFESSHQNGRDQGSGFPRSHPAHYFMSPQPSQMGPHRDSRDVVDYSQIEYDRVRRKR